MAAELPPNLKAAIAAKLEGVSRNALAERAAHLSATYRDGDGSATGIRDTADGLAYLVTRLPATYAAAGAVFAAFRDAAPDFIPRSLLDVGAGPGTASFAAVQEWPGIAAATMIELNRAFAHLAGDLTANAHPALAGGMRILADATRFGRDLPRANLVVAAYTLAEIAPAALAPLVASLWQATEGALVLVEPGTPAGFQRIRAARAALIAEGAGIAAPCPHAETCPIVEPDWCHFAIRLSRSRDHRLAKGADAPYEDEKFSYVVAVRPTVAVVPFAARVLAPPYVTKAEMRLKLCTSEGAIAERVVRRRDSAAYARVRRLWWGDPLGA